MLVIGCLDLDHDEVEAREGERLIRPGAGDDDSELGAARRAFTAAAAKPMASSAGSLEAPLVLLVPNARAQPSLQAVRMELLIDLVHELAAGGNGHWLAGFHALHRKDAKKATVAWRGAAGLCAASSGAQPAAAKSRCRTDGGSPGRVPSRGQAVQPATMRFVVVRGAKVRASMLAPLEAARVVRVDELNDVVRDVLATGKSLGPTGRAAGGRVRTSCA